MRQLISCLRELFRGGAFGSFLGCTFKGISHKGISKTLAILRGAVLVASLGAIAVVAEEPTQLIPPPLDKTAPPLEELAPPTALTPPASAPNAPTPNSLTPNALAEEELVPEPTIEEQLPAVSRIGLIEPTEPPWLDGGSGEGLDGGSGEVSGEGLGEGSGEGLNGKMGEGSGGLWHNAEGIFPAALLVESPIRKPRSPLGKLETQLLLQAASPPPRLKLESFLALRLNRLLAMHKTKEVKQMLEQSPDLARTSIVLARTKATASLIEYDIPSACDVERAIETQSELFWLKLKLICDVLEGEQQQAELTYEILTERFSGEVTLTNYLNLAAVLLGQKDKKSITVKSVTDFTELALLRLLELSPGSASYKNGTVAAMLFANPMASNLLRFKNGFEAAAAGTLAMDEFIKFLYSLPSSGSATNLGAKGGNANREDSEGESEGDGGSTLLAEGKINLDPKTVEGKMELMRRLINLEADEQSLISLLKAEADPLKALVLLELLKEADFTTTKNPELVVLLARLYYLNGEYQTANALVNMPSDEATPNKGAIGGITFETQPTPPSNPPSNQVARLVPWQYLFVDATIPTGDWLRKTIISSTNTAKTLEGLKLFYVAAEALDRSLGATNWWPIMAKVNNLLITEEGNEAPPTPDAILWLVPRKAESFGVRLAASLALPHKDFPTRFSPLTVGHTAHYWRSWGLESEAEELLRFALYASGI